jgi:signal transduction histidine kinase
MPSAKRSALPLILIPLLVAVFSWLVSQQIALLDTMVYERVLAGAGFSALSHESVPVPGFLSFLITLAACSAGFLAAVKLSDSGKIVVWVQAFIGLIAVQCALSYFFHWAGHPFGYIAALTFGSLSGLALKRLHSSGEARHSQYYELQLRNSELLDARLMLIRQAEIERRTLAADLHDQVLNDLKLVRDKVAAGSKDIEEIESLLSRAMGQVREVMDTLYPSVLEHLGLNAAIDDCLRQAAQRNGFKSRFSSMPSAALDSLGLVEQSMLYRLAQEAITNACKHASPALVKGAVEVNATHIRIVIADDGCGLGDPATHGQGRGMRYMRQRADLIGATISWRPGENERGTIVEIALPLDGRESDSSSDH